MECQLGGHIDVLIPWSHHDPGEGQPQRLSVLRGGGDNGGSKKEIKKGHGTCGTAFAIFSRGGWRTSSTPARSGVGHHRHHNKQERCHDRQHWVESQQEGREGRNKRLRCDE